MTAPVDLGPCETCGCGQWQHRQGKKGCKDVGCGCGKYEPPKAGPVPAVAVRRTAATCAYPNGEDEGEHDHALCEDVVAERAELAGVVDADPDSPVPGVAGERPDDADPGEPVGGPEPAQPGDVDLEPADEPDAKPPMPPADFLTAHTMVGERAAAGAGWQEGYLAGQAAAAAGPDPALAQAVAVAEALAAERDDARRERDRLASRLDIIRQERRREHLAHQVATLTDELEQARAVLAEENAGHRATLRLLAEARDRVVELEAHVARLLGHMGPGDPGRALVRYDADQCLTCGFRTTVPGLQHEHPLVPVSVLVVPREVSGAA
ncbi:hypothetical protein [Micromonospora carbonacea]|uniref:Uncharacterized protein n=1 Tax=Micromonospora carbonacea TaxID=47853 RepID=A0A1C4WWY7_9ACTN|nr:hypothetical protein [Micromonospora carbonacea]SCF00699.1 hypothetical protein GA0070563_10488 [Micromonospora carbonacea]